MRGTKTENEKNIK